ncbi:MAG: UxaA family hydrolase [Betaproteobacteria bacterium]|nr:UxaA family hydrolase [Betaproteobacteria bacterium]
MSNTALARSPVIVLHPDDNVWVARTDIAGGSIVNGIRVIDNVPAGHKLAAATIAKGEPIRKYATTIGFAAAPMVPGTYIHTHNLEFREYDRDYAPCSDVRPIVPIATAERRTFKGIVRPDGRVATRNYVAVLSSVNCSATAAKLIERRFEPIVAADYPYVDGVVAFTHSSGCGMGAGSALGMLRRIMAGYARHPNIVSVLFLGLGCERNQIADLLQVEGLPITEDLQFLNIQDNGGTQSTVAAASEIITEMLGRANRARRTDVDIGHIKLGLQCGGSDGYSAISANPALGVASDILVANGGTAILSETPEVYGVEHLLTRRAATPAVADDILKLIEWWKSYSKGESNQMTNNPPPGNQSGGLASIFEKSLGSAMKGGTAPIEAVYEFGKSIEKSGLVFMDSPGFDPISVTGQIAGGANMIAFTTGRGSAFGSKPAPCLKLSTTTSLYNRMADDIDVNCGGVVDGTETLEEVGKRVLEAIIETASGRRSKSELLGYGGNEFAPWILGAAT